MCDVQDQPHIDLFVFFSVFFSCFFLFLAACVLAWKIKQSIQDRRSRLRRKIEMRHMASRPFATVSVALDGPSGLVPGSAAAATTALPSNADDMHIEIVGGSALARYRRHAAASQATVPLSPIAVEPMADGSAAIVTVLIELPTEPQLPVLLALGSTLARMPAQGSWHTTSVRQSLRHRRPFTNTTEV